MTNKFHTGWDLSSNLAIIKTMNKQACHWRDSDNINLHIAIEYYLNAHYADRVDKYHQKQVSTIRCYLLETIEAEKGEDYFGVFAKLTLECQYSETMDELESIVNQLENMGVSTI
jgi:hypothetical protein